MVFESRVGETFLLGASTLAHRGDHARPRAGLARAGRAGQDAVLAGGRGRPAAGARAPHRRAGARAAAAAARRGDRAAGAAPRPRSAARPRTCCATSPIRPRPTGAVPDDRTIVIERCRDELGDWRVCVLSPFGGRVHAPWAMAVVERVARRDRRRRRDDVDRRRVRGAVSGDRRAAGSGADAAGVRRSRGAGRCGSSAAPRSSPRSSARPRRARCCCRGAARAAAARSGSSASAPPICWPSPRGSARSRCCSRRTASACATSSTCRRWSTRCGGSKRREIKPVTVDSTDAVAVRVGAALRLRRQLHLRRRRAARRAARAGAVDRSGAAARAARRSGAARAARRRRARRGRAAAAAARRHASGRKTVDGVHDLLLRLGDLTRRGSRGAQRRRRRGRRSAALVKARRARRGRHRRRRRGSCRSRTPARYRDALGVPLPPGLPEALLEPAPHAAHDLARRYARTHGPFTTAEVAARYGAGPRRRRRRC